MQPVIIIRHQRERLSKCSLKGLHEHPHVQFNSYPFHEELPTLDHVLKLSFDGPLLCSSDQARSLLILDATWKLASVMDAHAHIMGLESRSLDVRWKTAYPRKQTCCPDPERGLASIEAIYCSTLQMGREDPSWLHDYYWKNQFFDINCELIDYWRALSKETICLSH